MIKPKRSAEQQIADEADRRTLNSLTSRQTIADSQAKPEFQANHKRLKADRLAREARLKAKGK
jgi:cell division septum initiation protein DivIVA